MARIGIYVFLLVFLLGGCKKQITEQKDVIVKANDKVLTKNDVLSVLPKKLSSNDSLLWAESYVKQWVKDVLAYDVALRNMDDESRKEVNNLVNAYRRSLVRYRYQERLIQERLSDNITEEDKKAFYDQNEEKFVLDHSLLKGLFLKIPVDAPDLKEVKKWYRSTSEASIEKIEKYSVQNAVVYDYFYDKWVSFEEIIGNIPVKVGNENEFLRTNSFIETVDSSFCYLLNIEEYIPKGKTAPFEYVDASIVEMLINKRKIEFLKKFEEELYNDAIKGGSVVFTPEKP